MPTGRRAARELALKTIFQVDVGKQPISEVLDGALDQLRHPVRASLAERASSAKAALMDQAIPPDEEISAQSKRQFRGLARSLVGELDSLLDRATARCQETVAESGHFDDKRAIDDFTLDCDRSAESVRTRASKPTLYSEHADLLTRIALDGIPPVREHFENVIGPIALAGMYTVKLVHGAMEKKDEIDRLVGSLSSGWALERQAAVDRNILRLAVYELLFVEDVPVGAAINEAVELAHKYSTEESGKFVNGVLGALAAARAPALAES